MGEPRLYDQYDRHEAIALFGAEEGVRMLCDDQWVVLPDVVLCLAEIGEPPRSSHFTNGGGFCWVADQPYQVSDDQHIKFVPREVVGGQAECPAIHLFVQMGGSGRHLYVGKLGPACRFSLGGRDNHGEAFFDLSPALSSEVWIGLGGLRPGDLDHAAIDAALDRLRHPIIFEERLRVLKRLVEYWHGPIRPEDGIPEAALEGRTIPYPLRWWYRWAGRRSKILSGQNFLLDPEKVRVKDGLLEFYVENQYCYQWGTPFEGEDPPVFGRESPSDPWEPEGVTLSEHLILACLFEAIICHSSYGASASWLDEGTLKQITEYIPPIALNPLRWTGSTRFYAEGGAFMYAMGKFEIGGEQGYSVWIGAKTEHPLRFLKRYIDEGWEYVAV
jgi:hypothetical protein